MNKKLKWAEQICAAANGEIIERRWPASNLKHIAEWHTPSLDIQHLLNEMVRQVPEWEYRVKKSDLIIYRHLYAGQYNDYTHQQLTNNFGDQFKLTYCGDTGKLKAVEIVE